MPRAGELALRFAERHSPGSINRYTRDGEIIALARRMRSGVPIVMDGPKLGMRDDGTRCKVASKSRNSTASSDISHRDA